MNPRTRRHARRLQAPFAGIDPTRHNAIVARRKHRQRAEKKVRAAFGSFGNALQAMTRVITAFNASMHASAIQTIADGESTQAKMAAFQAQHPLGRKSDYALAADSLGLFPEAGE